MLDRMNGELLIVLLAGKAFLLSCGDDLSIHHESRYGVMIKSRNP
jgi:hypothetical protein